MLYKNEYLKYNYKI